MQARPARLGHRHRMAAGFPVQSPCCKPCCRRFPSWAPGTRCRSLAWPAQPRPRGAPTTRPRRSPTTTTPRARVQQPCCRPGPLPGPASSSAPPSPSSTAVLLEEQCRLCQQEMAMQLPEMQRRHVLVCTPRPAAMQPAAVAQQLRSRQLWNWDQNSTCAFKARRLPADTSQSSVS
jgi:hypothetical protein